MSHESDEARQADRTLRHPERVLPSPVSQAARPLRVSTRLATRFKWVERTWQMCDLDKSSPTSKASFEQVSRQQAAAFPHFFCHAIDTRLNDMQATPNPGSQAEVTMNSRLRDSTRRRSPEGCLRAHGPPDNGTSPRRALHAAARASERAAKPGHPGERSPSDRGRDFLFLFLSLLAADAVTVFIYPCFNSSHY